MRHTITGPLREFRRYPVGRHATAVDGKTEERTRSARSRCYVLTTLSINESAAEKDRNYSLQNSSTQRFTFFGLPLVLPRTGDDICFSIPANAGLGKPTYFERYGYRTHQQPKVPETVCDYSRILCFAVLQCVVSVHVQVSIAVMAFLRAAHGKACSYYTKRTKDHTVKSLGLSMFPVGSVLYLYLKIIDSKIYHHDAFSLLHIYGPAFTELC